MNFIIMIVVVAAVVFTIWFSQNIRQKMRRQQVVKKPFPKEWADSLIAYYPLYRVLPEALKHQLQDHIRIFIDEKTFEGQGGLTLTDEIRVIIAAQACILLLNRKTDYYPSLKTIIVYPHNYVSDNGAVCGGESWTYGPVVLSWDAVKHGVSDMRDGHNVVYHEFAHQLDQEDGAGDGTPILSNMSNYQLWTSVFTSEFKRHISTVFENKETVLRAYGTVHPAEFFAVAAEAFFEKPVQMKKAHTDLYEEMQRFFRVDPASWF